MSDIEMTFNAGKLDFAYGVWIAKRRSYEAILCECKNRLGVTDAAFRMEHDGQWSLWVEARPQGAPEYWYWWSKVSAAAIGKLYRSPQLEDDMDLPTQFVREMEEAQ